MADMTLGLTKKAVEGTLSRVMSAIDEDTKLKAAVQQDLRFIVAEFQMMQSFLKKVTKHNKESASNDEVDKTWVRQLRELAIDVEDCVEFVIHLDNTSARARLSWVWRVVRLPSRMTPAWVGDLDQAVAQLKQLKASVEELIQRKSRYSILSGDDSGGSTTIPRQAPPEQLHATAFPSTVDILRDLWKASAKQSSPYKCIDLQYLVTNRRSNDLRVISVWRATGVDLETTHILSAAYRDPKICKEFKARARVKLMHPFNIQEFLESLLNQLYVTSHQQDTLGGDLLRTKGDCVIQEELRQLLSKHKYLVILEDLSSTVEWDLIRFYLPDLHNGSRIVISTQQLGVALSCTGEPYQVLQLALFPNNDRYIYAFIKHSSTIGTSELVRQLGQRRVISLWGDDDGDTTSLLRDVYEAMKNQAAAFEQHYFVWVKVPSTTSLEVNSRGWFEGFCRCLPGYLYYENLETYFAEFSKALCEIRNLIVIEGLQSTEDWDLIKDAGLVPEDTKSCIVIIANEQAVAKHCHDDSSRKMDDKEQETIIGALFAQQEEKYYSWGHRLGSHGCRIDEALFKLEKFITPYQEELLKDFFQFYIRSYGVNAVWGETGVGKSALVKFIYYTVMAYSLKMIEETELPRRDLLDGERFCWAEFQRFGWVDVPDEPFDLAEFSRRLLLDFNSVDPGEMEKTAVSIIQCYNYEPIQRCYEIIHRQRCLVVIDGLRSTCDWDCIKQAPWFHHHRESSIFVITTDERIAEHCVIDDSDGNARIIHITPLDDKSARELFIKVAEEHNNEWTTDQNLKHAKRIVPKCAGLPKIIDAVAKSPCYFWENINDDLVVMLESHPQFHHLRGLLSRMHSKFDACSDSVKPCIFYLSVFPRIYKIRKAHMLRRWIAEGYSRDASGFSAKENAERLFSELVYMGIIQELSSMPLCQISGFLFRYIVSQPMEDNLVFALEGQRRPNSQRAVQHLTIMEDWEREKHVFESIDVSRLRSLTVYGKWESFFISDDKMKRIRVLDLQGTSGLEDDELRRVFRILLSLKFICLRGCKSITCLPKTLGGLRQLESLDVRGTSIVTLPQAITQLKKIQYIRAGMFLPFEDWTSVAEDASDDADGSQPSGTTPTPTPTPPVATNEGPSQAPISQDKQVDGERQKKLVGCCWTSTKLSPGKLRSWFGDNNIINGGVEVPVGIEDMPALHTLGTVNIKGAGGKDFLTMLQGKKSLHKKKASGGKDFLTKLPQLLKLSVCGINKENWKDLCDALSAHDHLESLSLGFDEDFTDDSCFNNPPRALRSLGLYGHIHRLPAWPWIKDLKKFDLEVIISSQGDMDQLVEWLPYHKIVRRLCIKPIEQVRELEFKTKYGNRPRVLKIDCCSQFEVAFQISSIAADANVLIIHCSEGSDFRISSNEESGLKHVQDLTTVWLKGYDEKAEYVAHLKEQVAAHPGKPVFKFEKLESA